MTKRILIAHPRGAETQAREAADELRALGYEVRDYGQNAKRTATDKVLVLWSRAASRSPALRVAAQKAHATRSLIYVRLDNARPPFAVAQSLTLNGKASSMLEWRRALAPSPRATPMQTRLAPAARTTQRARRIGAATKPVVETQMSLHVKEKNSRLFAIALTLSLLAETGAGYAYGRYPAFAAPIDQAATAAYTKASEIAAFAP